MRKNSIYLITILAMTLFIWSCAKEGPTGPTGAAGPSFTGGTINGHASLYDQYGNKVLTGLDSITLILTGVTTPYTYTVTADVNGLYTCINTTTGDYTLTANRNNYAATQLTDFPYLLGTLNKDIKLSAIPDSFLTSFSITHSPGSLYDSLVITATADPMPRNCIVFVNNNRVVNNNELIGYILSYTHSIPANTTSITIPVSDQELVDAGFIGGTSMVYYAAYSYVVDDGSVYEDFATGRNVYNAVNANPIVDSATAP